MCGMSTTVAGRTLDPESAEWIRRLSSSGRDCERARSDLHAMLLRFARSQANRRAGRFQVTGPEIDDVAHQAAADAMIAITGKLGDFRGDSRFTTWAFKFVLLEVSSKLGRHFWRDAGPHYDTDDWDRLPDVFGLDPAQETEWRDLIEALRRAINTTLSEQQRQLFVWIVLRRVPLDALVEKLGSNRNAIYKSLFDARRKLRAALVADGYLHNQDLGSR
jgi:RNA polymerase sigma-70 factor (ECF subfamily)